MNAIKNLKDGIKQIEEGMRTLDRGPLNYYLDKLDEYAEALFERFAPFKEGDKVILTRTPTINEKESWGWLAYRHFLVIGSVAKVISVDYLNGQFVADIEFDNHTIMDSKGQIRMVDKNQKGTFRFSEEYLTKL